MTDVTLCMTKKRSPTTTTTRSRGARPQASRGSQPSSICRGLSVQSGAEESVCPRDWGKQFEMYEPERWMKLRAASGGKIEHYGKRDVKVLPTTF